MFHSASPFAPEKVKAQTVGVRIDHLQKPGPHLYPTGWINVALKDGILHPLAIVFADTGDAAQPFGTTFGGYSDVICYENQHRYPQIQAG